MSRQKPDRRRKSPVRQSTAAALTHSSEERVKALTTRGIELAGQGDLSGAAAQFLEAVRLQPRVHYLHGNLGNILQMLGDLESAAEHYRRALELEPGDVQACSNLGVLLHKQGRTEEAVARLRQAIEAKPDYHDALNNLGNVLQDTGDLDGALDCYERALLAIPGSAAAHRGIGNVMLRRRECEEAAHHYEQVLEVTPDDVDVYRVLASALVGAGRWQEGIERLRRTLEDLPPGERAHLLGAMDCLQQEQFDDALARVDEAVASALASPPGPTRRAMAEALGIFSRVLMMHHQSQEHERILRHVLALTPDDAHSHLELGVVLHWSRREEEAILEYARALQLDPLLASAWSNLSRAYLERGRLDEAKACLERALEIEPTNSIAHSSLIFVGDQDAHGTQEQALAERLRWRDRHAAHLSVHVAPHANSPVEGRRLRVGYVSGDLRHHSAASCLSGVLCFHDPAEVEMVCYSTFEGAPDPWTERFRSASSLWRDVAHLSDEAVCDLIREDGIDVLVDLSGHSARNRLLVFARKPAPVQVTAWGYATGTGLDTVDYVFIDEVCCPPDSQRYFVEKLWYLPCALSYEPPRDPVQVAALPAAAGQGVTFGCLNRLSKMGPECLEVWARILKACPGSRLLLKAAGLLSPEMEPRVRRPLESMGIDPARLILMGDTSQEEHLATFHQVDIALDPFPHGGGMTTLEGVWMGVPAVTLLGRHGAQSRITSSIMMALGLDDFVARTSDEYVDVAVRRAQEVSRLVELRKGLRLRLLASPVVGGVPYCRAVEAAYREMWRTWCRSRVAAGG